MLIRATAPTRRAPRRTVSVEAVARVVRLARVGGDPAAARRPAQEQDRPPRRFVVVCFPPARTVAPATGTPTSVTVKRTLTVRPPRNRRGRALSSSGGSTCVWYARVSVVPDVPTRSRRRAWEEPSRL